MRFLLARRDLSPSLFAVNIYALELARFPNIPLKVMLRFGKTLVRDKSGQTNVVIDNAIVELLEQIARVDAALTARLAASNPEAFASETDFDYAVDGLWIALRRSLELHTAYAHRGLGALPEALADKAALEQLRIQAKRARRLWERLFASDGTAFIKQRYIVQAESMGALLRLINEHELREDLEDVVGADLVGLLEVCQVHYEDMVSARLARQQGTGHNLNELRNDLRWAIVAYINAVHSLYKRSEPKTAELVLAALRSVLSLRESAARGGGVGENDDDELDELDEVDADELDADELEADSLIGDVFDLPDPDPQLDAQP